MAQNNDISRNRSLRRWAYDVIFEADTVAGKVFDIVLLVAILVSVVIVMLESVSSIEWRHGDLLRTAEWIFTIAFTIEYLLRLWCVRKPWLYARSFFGVTDFLGFIPTYISVFIPGTHFLMVVRIVRLVRVFRVFKLARYLEESKVMLAALRASRPKIVVFLVSVLTAVIVIGSIIYLIEGEKNGFTSIPQSIYWAVVTMTTVGYGDISPKTPLGQFLSIAVMIIGYAIIAVPTGIISFDVIKKTRKHPPQRICTSCGTEGHESDAKYCKYCGEKL